MLRKYEAAKKEYAQALEQKYLQERNKKIEDIISKVTDDTYN